jgi:hypothetical protein
VIVPERLALTELAATEYVTVPLPTPFVPAVTEIHATLLTAVHTHPAAAVTVVVPVPPTAVKELVVGASA